MSTKVANGSGLSTPRPPFRRQGSSVAGGAHPMTIALAPVPKVDYSVTKGGARTWAVLLVFMFLCSSLYTVFSAKEIAEMAVDMDGDGSFDLDDDVADDVDEVAAQQRRAMRDTTPSSDELRPNDRRHYDQNNRQPSIQTADDDEDEDEKDELETQLFAGLRKKIERNYQKVKKMVQETKEAHNDAEEKEQEEDETPQVERRQRRRKNRKGRDVEETVEEEREEVKAPPRKERKTAAQRKREEREKEEKKREEQQQEEDDDDDDDDEDEDEKAEEEKEDDEKEDEVVEHQKDEDDDDEEEKKEEKKEERKEEKEKEDKEAEEREEEEEQPHRKKRRHVGSVTWSSPDRECHRKHCPPAYAAAPRKSLLKKKKGESTSSKRYRPMSASELESFEDDFADDDEEGEEENEKKEAAEEEVLPIHEVVAVKKYRSSGRDAYKRHAITNREDHRHRVELDKADFLVEKHDYAAALSLFDEVLRVSPHSPRAHFGKARAYDIRSEYSADETDMDKAIQGYERVVENEDTPEALFRQAADRLIDRSRFRGHMHRCLQAQRTLIDRFPEDLDLQTDFALTFLMMKRHDDARKIFKDVLEIDPNNAIALAYYGYILKVVDHDIEGGVSYMRRGLRLGGDKIGDAKFYYHLGHALMYLGKSTEAYSVYEQGAELGLFLSAQQRSMYNVEGLTGRPWWSLEQTGYSKYLKSLERQWVSIRHEAVRALHDLPDYWVDENPSITVDGHWLSYSLMSNGIFSKRNCQATPQTCSILSDLWENSNATKSEMRFSVLSSGAQVLPHCGPSNTRLQAHMGLVVPSEARIRVGQDQRGWKTGKFIIFDDSFEHEMQFDGASSSSFRLVLVVDLWHPEVDVRDRHEPERDD